MTLTFADNVTCRLEAARRFKSLHANFLSKIPDFEYAAAVERQARGAIHYHLVCALPWDIRTGFDFKALSAANSSTKAGNLVSRRRIENDSNFYNAPATLRTFWSQLRSAARRYHFGRCETLPIISNAEACARYVGSYVGKEFALREQRDKGLRTVRYRMNQRVAHPQFSWVSGHGRVWRLGCSLLSLILDVPDFTTQLGKNWSWKWRREISMFGRYPEKVADAFRLLDRNTSLSDRQLTAITLARQLSFFHQYFTSHSRDSVEEGWDRYCRSDIFIRRDSLITKRLVPFYRLDLRASALVKNAEREKDSPESHPKKPPLPSLYP